MNRRSWFPSCRSVAFLALPGLLMLPACSDPPVTPTPPIVSPPVTPPAPALACPAPVSVTSPSGNAFPVPYPPPTVTGGTPPVTVTCAPPSGSTFPIGATAVTCTATDQVGRTATCGFTVTVTAPPRLTRDAVPGVWRQHHLGRGRPDFEHDARRARRSGRACSFRPPTRTPVRSTGCYRPATRRSRRTVLNAGKPGEAVTDPATFPAIRQLHVEPRLRRGAADGRRQRSRRTRASPRSLRAWPR